MEVLNESKTFTLHLPTQGHHNKSLEQVPVGVVLHQNQQMLPLRAQGEEGSPLVSNDQHTKAWRGYGERDCLPAREGLRDPWT